MLLVQRVLLDLHLLERLDHLDSETLQNQCSNEILDFLRLLEMEPQRKEESQGLVTTRVPMVRKNDSKALDETLMMAHSAVDTRQDDIKKKNYSKM